jgi:hypothetical protein
MERSAALAAKRAIGWIGRFAERTAETVGVFGAGGELEVRRSGTTRNGAFARRLSRLRRRRSARVDGRLGAAAQLAAAIEAIPHVLGIAAPATIAVHGTRGARRDGQVNPESLRISLLLGE